MQSSKENKDALGGVSEGKPNQSNTTKRAATQLPDIKNITDQHQKHRKPTNL
jgi:hypothetical protein